MITLHSINLRYTHDKCCAETHGGCRVLIARDENCRTYKCPFYKPEGCKDWVRVDDKRGSNLIPPEEYKDYYRRRYEQRTGIRKP